MSTILKALRRVETDKNSQVRRPLRQEVAGGAEPRRRFPIAWVAAGVFTAGIGIGAAALFLWPAEFLGFRSEEPTASTPAVAAAEAPGPRSAAPPPDRELKRPPGSRARPTAPPPAASSAPAQAPARATAPPSEHDVAVVRQISPTPLRLQETGPGAEPAARPPRPGSVRPGAEAMKPKPRPPAPKPTRVAAASATESPAPSPQPAARPAEPKPRPETAAFPEPEPELAPPAPEPAPPVRRRAGVPVILVSRTEWHPMPERREALIEVEMADGTETRRVREGDAVGSLVVERIEPSGVVFDYEGVELRHGVGSGP